MGAGASTSHCEGCEVEDNSSLTAAYGNASDEQKVLMAQAQAHWRRMIIHANTVEKNTPSLVSGGTSEEERVQRTINMYKEAERRDMDHKAEGEVVDGEEFDRALQKRLAPLDEVTLIARSNSDIVLRRTASGDPLPYSASSPKILRASRSSANLQDLFAPPTPTTSSSTTSAPLLPPKSSDARPSTPSQVASFRQQPMISADCLRAISSLPPVRVDLRSRTGSSLTLTWDTDMEALISLRKVLDAAGTPIAPRYEVTHRKAQHKSDFEAMYDRSIQENKASKWQWLQLDDETSCTGVIADLQPDTQYCIRCRRMQWSEEWGVTLTVRTGPGPPAAVEDLHAKEVSSSSVLLAWSPPAADNGLPVLHYAVQKKRLGGEFQEVFRGKERLFLATDLAPNAVYIFEVVACNRVGAGSAGERLASRTLQPGSAAMTPWTEAVDSDSGKLFFRHPKTAATAWVLPKGAVLDQALSLQNKIAHLRLRVRALQAEARRGLPPDKLQLELRVSRANLLEESLGQVRLASPAQLLASPMKIIFADEAGVDGGGLSREWAVELIKLVVSSSSGLFQMEDNGGGAVIDVRAEALHGSECRWLFAALARVFAKCIIEGLVLGVRFSRLFLSWLSAKPPSLEDLHAMDASLYRGLTWVLENDVSDMDLTFSASFELLDAQHTVSLGPGGSARTVTEGNKREYVELMMAWLVRGRFEPAVTHFVESFHAVLPLSLFQHFSLADLQLLISGSPEVDVAALQAETCYTGGYGANTVQVQWFWEVLEQELSGEEVSGVLAFVTGCPCVPHSGLKPPLTITMIESGAAGTETELVESRDAILPRSHTCFHQLLLPLYSSREKMVEKLRYALRNSEGGGFHLA